MIDSSLQKQILNELGKLGFEQQRRVLDFARTLTEPRGVPGQKLLSFAGAIEADDLQVMAEIIEEDCEKVSVYGW